MSAPSKILAVDVLETLPLFNQATAVTINGLSNIVSGGAGDPSSANVADSQEWIEQSIQMLEPGELCGLCLYIWLCMDEKQPALKAPPRGQSLPKQSPKFKGKARKPRAKRVCAASIEAVVRRKDARTKGKWRKEKTTGVIV